MTRERNLFKNTVIISIGNFSTKALGFFLLPFYTHYFSTGDYGYYDIIVTIITLLVPIVSIQITDGLYRYLLDTDTVESRNEVLSNCFFILIKNIIISIIFYIVLINFFTIKFGDIILVQLILSVLSAFWFQGARGNKDNIGYSLAGVFATFIALITNIVLVVFTNMRVEALIYSSIFSNITVIIYLEVRLRLRSFIKLSYSNKSLKLLLVKYSLPLIPNSLCWWFMNLSDRFMLNHYLGMEANGIYAIANKFPTMLILINSMFYLAWQETAITEYNSKDRNAFYSDMFNKLLVLLCTAILILLPFTKPLIILLVNPDFVNAWVYIPFLYLGALFSAFSSFYGTGYLSTKDTMGASLTSLLGAAVNLIANFLLIPVIGIQGASLSTMLAFFVMWFARVYQTRKYYEIIINRKNLILLGSLLTMFTCLYYVNSFSIQILLSLFSIVFFSFYNRNIIRNIIVLFKKKLIFSE